MASRQPATFWAIAALILVPVAASLPTLTGLVNCDPETLYSGLGQNLSPGLIPGNACFLDPTVGYITQPLGYLSAEDWLHGIIPWWNPYSGVGMPLAAEMQNESFFLPFVLLLHFKSGWLYQRVIFQSLSGIFTYAFLRARHLHKNAALTGGLLFALNGSFFLHAGTAAAPIFGLPLMMLGVERTAAATFAGKPLGWSCLTAGLAASIYAGFPEIAFFDILLVGLWIILRGLQLPTSLRRSYTRKIAVSVAIGLALTAPLVIAFVQYLALADLAEHGNTFLTNSLPRAAAPIAILPFIYGALGLAVSPSLTELTGDAWVKFGGWIGCLPCLFALAAIIRADDNRAARFTLAGFLAAWLARDFNLLDIRVLFNLVPVIAHADAVRFSWIAREFAAYTLAAYGVNDLLTRPPPRRVRLTLIIGAFSLLVIAAIATARPVLNIWFASLPALIPFAACYLAICLAACAAACCAIAKARFGAAMTSALIAGAFAICLAPQLAAPRGGSLDSQALAKLQSLSPFARIYTLGPFGPNFPAASAIASINHSQLPVPKLWTDFITNQLFPGGNVIDFTGNQTDQLYGLISNLPTYQAIGVQYVLSAPRQNLALWRPPPRAINQRSGFVLLVPQSQITGLTAPLASSATITSAALVIGTVHGESTGPLQLRLCAASHCSIGQLDTTTIPDATQDRLNITPPLQVPMATPVSFTISHPHGAWVSVFLTGTSATTAIAAGLNQAQPGTLVFAKSHNTLLVNVTYTRTIPSNPADPASLPLLYQDALISIHQLPSPAPYATTGNPACALQILSRQHFTSNCPAPAILTRRELFFPGWQARINGNPTLITQTATIFEAITLPAGPADIRFTYQPLHTHLACLVAILALLAWSFCAARGRLNRPPTA